MDDNRLILHERPMAFIIAPDAPRLRIGSRLAENPPEHLQRGVNPAILVNWGRSVTLDARNEQDDENALAATFRM
jgi:hypothetical protein